jgi:hypothetical protein
MKRPPEYYTLWNQAVEAVEIYLARNPRELTEEQLQDLFKATQFFMTCYAGSGQPYVMNETLSQEFVKRAMYWVL